MTDTIKETPISITTRVLATLISAACIMLVFGLFYAIYAYIFQDAEHPLNAVTAFAGFPKVFLKTSEFEIISFPRVIFSFVTVLLLYLGLAVYTLFSTLSLIELVKAGSFKQYKIIKAAAIAKAKKEEAESYSALVDMPRFTKEDWYEILSAAQSDMVRNFDALHGSTNIHPAVRERTERSVLILGDACTIIAKRLTGTDDLLTQSFKAARIKSNGQISALPRAKYKESNS